MEMHLESSLGRAHCAITLARRIMLPIVLATITAIMVTVFIVEQRAQRERLSEAISTASSAIITLMIAGSDGALPHGM